MDISLVDSVKVASQPETAAGFGRAVQAAHSKDMADYQRLQDGMADLAGNQAYYVYYTLTSDKLKVYALRVYLVFPVQRAAGVTYRGFWLEGGVLNEPQSIRDNIPVIQQIIWSFRPK